MDLEVLLVRTLSGVANWVWAGGGGWVVGGLVMGAESLGGGGWSTGGAESFGGAGWSTDISLSGGVYPVAPSTS